MGDMHDQSGRKDAAAIPAEIAVVRIEPRESFLAERAEAIRLRRQFLNGITAATVLVDLGAFDYMTIASARALIADWAADAYGRGLWALFIATTNVDVIESVDAALRATGQHASWVQTPEDLEKPQPLGGVTSTDQFGSTTD